MDQVSLTCQRPLNSDAPKISYSIPGFACVQIQTHAHAHIMWGQSRAGPVVCHSEAIRGEPTQVNSCQSSDERQAGLMRLYSPGEMNVTHKTYKVLHALILHDAPQTPSEDSVSLEQQTPKKRACACTWTRERS